MESIGKLIIQGGFTMVVLLLCSVLLLAVVFERIYIFWKNKVDHEWLLHNLSQFLQIGQFKEAQEYSAHVAGWLPRVMEAGLARHELSKPQIEEAMEADIAIQGLAMDKNVNIIGTIAVIAPFIGLFGTVLGIIRAFQDIAMKGQTGPEVVSKGVAEALIATAAGLFVAITAVIFYNYLKGKIRQGTAQMRVSATRLSEMIELKKEGKAFPALTTTAAVAAGGEAVQPPAAYQTAGGAPPAQAYAPAAPAPSPQSAPPGYPVAPEAPLPQAYPAAPPPGGAGYQAGPAAQPAPTYAAPAPAPVASTYQAPQFNPPPASGGVTGPSPYRAPTAAPPYPAPDAQRPGQPPPYGTRR